METNNDCIFCKIINNEMPSYCVYEDDYFKVILDIFPAGIGHTLVITKEHAADIFDLSDEAAKRLMPLVKRIAVMMQKSLDPDGINILQNNREAAGQTVFHYHMQIIPRFNNDEIKIKWAPTKHGSEKFDEVLIKYKKNLCRGD